MVVSQAEPTHLLADLTPAQRRAVTAPSPTVCVLASAGAGKTRVLTRRIAYRVLTGSAKSDHALAITFTRKAAGEMSERLAGLGLARAVTAGTFHSFALSQLRRWWADRRTPEPALLQSKVRLLAELATDRPGLVGGAPGELAGQIEWAKARLVGPASFAAAAGEARRELPADAEAIAGLYARYEDEKRSRRLVDFDDLLGRYADALGADTRFAAAQRWRWRHLFIDELQDVNPLQCRLLVALLGDNDDLFVVGDPNQAIYGWNGADPGFLNDFPRRWPAAEVVRLDDNHRSSPQVVAAAAAVLGRHAGTSVRSSQPEGPLPGLRSYPSDEAEAAGVASEVVQAHGRGLHWGELAVLARTNFQLEMIGRALDRAGVPFRAVAANEDDEGNVSIDGDVEGAPAPANSKRPADGPGGRGGQGGRGEKRDRPPLGAGFGDGQVTVCSFHRAKGLQWKAVWVCGLEAGLVPIAYASGAAALAEERRLLYVALTRAERELHCSWARARRPAKSANAVLLRREPSPWLPALAAQCAGAGEERETGVNFDERDSGVLAGFFASARTRLSRSKASALRTGPALGPEEAAVADGLREWRRRLARASGVPPHVLLHDATVQVIAARKPTSAEELLAVPGLGPVKVARFGPAILEVVQQGRGAAPEPATMGGRAGMK